MPTFADPQFRELDAANRRAQELLDKGDFAAALIAFQAVVEMARKVGVDVSWPHWGLAVCHDNLGDLVKAFEHMRESLRTDPLNIGKQGSFDTIVQRIRTALAAPDRSERDPDTPRLYQVLAQAREADVGAHLAMARHLATAGKPAEAMRLLEAVTVLNPGHRGAWERKAAIARSLGDQELASRCDIEAAGSDGRVEPFGVGRAAAGPQGRA